MRKTNNFCLVFIILFFGARSGATSYAHPNPLLHLQAIQYSDLAGVATIQNAEGSSLTINVKTWWLGEWGTNTFALEFSSQEFEKTRGWSPGCEIGKDVVFFAVTNAFKGNALVAKGTGELQWNFAQSFTNSGPACTPRFVMPTDPLLYLVDTNHLERVNVLSNITQSVFITRDQMQLYRALRDGYNTDTPLYKGMSVFPLGSLIFNASESNLIEMASDAQLSPGYRLRATQILQQKYGWTPTNAIPGL